MCALTILSHSKLPTTYWSYVISTVEHLINRLPTPLLHSLSPWELLFNAKPDLLHLKVFGCTCFPLLKPRNTHKFQPHTSPCVFLDYPPYSDGYRCLEPHSHRIYVTRHVLFNQHDFSALTQVSTSQSSASPSNSPSPTLWLTFLLHSCSQSILQPFTHSNSTAQSSSTLPVLKPSPLPSVPLVSAETSSRHAYPSPPATSTPDISQPEPSHTTSLSGTNKHPTVT